MAPPVACAEIGNALQIRLQGVFFIDIVLWRSLRVFLNWRNIQISSELW